MNLQIIDLKIHQEVEKLNYQIFKVIYLQDKLLNKKLLMS